MASPSARPLSLPGEDLTFRSFYDVVLGGKKVQIAPVAKRRMAASHRTIQQAASKPHPVYGVTTGFGKLADQRISPSDVRQLQLNLVRSHAAGVGDPLSREETRGMLLLRANVLARGYSGVRPLVTEYLVTLLNRDVVPVVPSRGSVGASGDLAPMAH